MGSDKPKFDSKEDRTISLSQKNVIIPKIEFGVAKYKNISTNSIILFFFK